MTLSMQSFCFLAHLQIYLSSNALCGKFLWKCIPSLDQIEEQRERIAMREMWEKQSKDLTENKTQI